MNSVEIDVSDAAVTVETSVAELETIEVESAVTVIEAPEQGPQGASGVPGVRGATGATGLPGQVGATGAVGGVGPSGATGAGGALPWTYDASSLVMANPGPGKFRLNDADVTLATQIAISNVCAVSLSNLNSYLANVGLGQLSIIDSATGKAAMLATGLFFNPDSSGTGWVRFTVTYEGGPSALTGGNNHTLFFAPQGASGATGSTGPQGSTGLQGATGPQGSTGAAGQVPWVYDASSTAMANPGVGKFRLNSATVSAATQIAISNQSVAAAVSLNSYLANIGLGQMTIVDPATGKAAAFATGLFFNDDATATGWVHFDITFEGGVSSFTDTNRHYLNFSPQGASGATGSTGPIGASGATGPSGNLRWQYDSSSTSVASNPGIGKVVFNDANPLNATFMAVSNQSLNSADSMYTFFKNAGFGTIVVTDEANGRVVTIRVFNVIDQDTSATGWTNFSIFPWSGSSALVNGSQLAFTFPGAKGATGTQGQDGTPGSFSWNYSSTTTFANPGNGAFRFDNANWSSGGGTPNHTLMLSNTASSFISTKNLNSWLTTFPANSQLTLASATIGSAAVFRINSITNQDASDGGWISIGLTWLAGATGAGLGGTLYGFTFGITGATGAVGATGAAGATGPAGATGAVGASGSPGGATGATGAISYVNRFYNAGCEVDLRNTAAIAGTGMTVTTSGAHVVDGCIVVPTGASVTAQQVDAASGMASTKALRVTGAASVTGLAVRRRVAAVDAAKMTGNRVTVQCKVKQTSGASVTPTLSVGHAATLDTYGGVGAASLTNEVNAVSMQACADGVTTTLAYTFDVSSGALGLEFTWNFGATFTTTGKNVVISDFDVRITPADALGLNSSPQVPEIKNHAIALLECKAYFQRLWHPGSGTYYSLCVAAVVSATAAYAIVVYPVPMRKEPDLTLSAPGDILIGAVANFTPTAAAISHKTEASALLTLTISGGSAQAGLCIIAYPGYIELNAELI